MEKKVSTTNISKHWRNRNTKELGSNAIYFKVQGYDPNHGPCSSVITMTSLNYSYKNNNKNSNKEDVGTPKPKKHANKVGRLT